MKTLFLIFCFALLPTAWADGGREKYPSYTELAKQEKEGVDYKVEVDDRASCVAVFAIHGGTIEKHTDTIAHQIAQTDGSYYIFQGMKELEFWDLHVTSHRFDDPRAINLAHQSQTCVSVHGFVHTKPAICLGGSDDFLAHKVAEGLKGQPFDVIYPCTSFPGDHPENIVNRCQDAGVQLEYSSGLRKLFETRPALMKTISRIVKSISEAHCS